MTSYSAQYHVYTVQTHTRTPLSPLTCTERRASLCSSLHLSLSLSLHCTCAHRKTFPLTQPQSVLSFSPARTKASHPTSFSKPTTLNPNRPSKMPFRQPLPANQSSALAGRCGADAGAVVWRRFRGGGGGRVVFHDLCDGAVEGCVLSTGCNGFGRWAWT